MIVSAKEHTMARTQFASSMTKTQRKRQSFTPRHFLTAGSVRSIWRRPIIPMAKERCSHGQIHRGGYPVHWPQRRLGSSVAPADRNVGDVGGPHLIGPVDLETSEQIGEHRTALAGFAGLGTVVPFPCPGVKPSGQRTCSMCMVDSPIGY